jgi:two-component system chemotaxis response regulator CheB
LETDPDIEVVGKASDPIEAMQKIKELNPTLLTLDVHMPKMNGIDFLKKLMVEHPMPVVVISSVSDNVFDALNAGAVEFVTKPTEGKKVDLFTKEIIVKVKIASVAKLKIPAQQTTPKPSRTTIRPIQSKTDNNTIRQIEIDTSSTSSASRTSTSSRSVLPIRPISSGSLPKVNLSGVKKDIIVAIGASTGGTEAILAVIKDLPADMPGIVIVQHMPPGFTAMYAKRADNICKMKVKEAAEGDRIERGRILIAPGALQMRVRRDAKGFYVSCQPGEKVSGHAPSVDVLFDSMAEVVGGNSVGIILTGMGSDGAKGLLAMRKKGSYTIGQDEKSCGVYGMPKVSYNMGAVTVQADLDNIPSVLMNYLNKP